ncbi:unnamed protein product [Tilletia controversa]|uniref:Uncharacterized protein n=3 Tax=Tilletia TaxID=13289 RepID=A0A8X7MY87_9BASI|nr:hypothetical protein CF328_g2790 [Tilletia controversa]CAD6892538.1 unnamed protein product [Tilletia caries]CAD6952436.1 unnamed protein product [Tilletia laevis]KAE8252564.1 hypothetical protein A4X06_0g2096 [Tilletia controversa]CAD6928071.1 unnamed protein product [Tilletia controversa]
MSTAAPSTSGVKAAAAHPNAAAQRKDNALHSVTAGTIAGAVEGFITYPVEYTISQFAAKQGAKAPSPIAIIRSTIAKDGYMGLYSGCGALVAGNAVKAGVRFLSYDYFKTKLRDKDGRLSGPRSLLAGLGAGMMEAVFAVTPSETIKTKLIDDAKRDVPKYPRSLIGGTRAIIAEEGLRGIYRGLGPVMLRQGANSSVRFGTYATLKNLVQGSARPGQSLPGGITFAIGALAGVVTVYTTMPFDVIKTRMQSLEARTRYTNMFNCATVTFREEGLKAFWRGATPRLARLVLSGGIVFSVYEEVMKLLDTRTV